MAHKRAGIFLHGSLGGVEHESVKLVYMSVKEVLCRICIVSIFASNNKTYLQYEHENRNDSGCYGCRFDNRCPDGI